ncbi:MAG: tyrosine-protein phosphatase [Thermodesulfobacteriota bacterium]
MLQFITNRRQKFYWTVMLLAAMMVILGTTIYHLETRPEHFVVVEDGVLYRSALLTPDNLNKVLDRYGIKTVVDLSAEHDRKRKALHEEESRICRNKGVAWIPLSLPPETPPDDMQIARWLDLMKNPGNHPVLVHCTHGVVRTGMMTAIYEMELRGTNNRQTFAGLPTFGHDWEDNVREFILNYSPRSTARINMEEKTIDPV